jgi:ABC-type spermidine/putrescine transport system permease subunit II
MMHLRTATASKAVLLSAALCMLLWPLVHAVWLSFAPGELLETPTTEWSLRWYRSFFGSARWVGGLANSGWVATLSAVFAAVLGTGLALGMAGALRDGGEPRADSLLARAVLLPLFVPPAVLGMALLPLMRALGLWGHLASLALAHSLLGLPVVYLAVRDALRDLDPNLALAARGLGASRAMTLWRVTLPPLVPAIVFGALTAFVFSLNEFVIALFLATPAIETLPKVIWPNLRYTLTPIVAAASTVAVAVSLLLLAATLLLRRWAAAWGSALLTRP